MVEKPSRTSLRRPDRARALRGARRIGGENTGVVVATNTAWVAVPKGMGQSRSMANERRCEIADRVRMPWMLGNRADGIVAAVYLLASHAPEIDGETKH